MGNSMIKEIDIKNFTKCKNCKKGDIFWHGQRDINPEITSIKVRPYIIIGRNNPKSKRILVSPVQKIDSYIENGKLKYPYHVALLQKDHKFLTKDSVVLLDQIYTISKEELYKENYMGTIKNLKDLDDAITYNFDLYESMLEGIKGLLSSYQSVHKEKYSRK
ncbi:type II toxin-antitoxin system PemK/MazF family toxin (plasmid) [Clostridium perfringens]|uniref:PemK family of DNA-binding protein n=1 Tax=Clostridium perfringens E str. JGS1987 TaxID=451755 RepID=B1BUC6_CLOPF|nr:type II toxin-antitoxin system PemK/MazF family toxin [Clostridium perfringens]EDT14737.1 pemK family of DNA-binding protein [Clostridium perfringens E str. JGS1987]EJT6557626.1 type II toxin-antitoxin system PemK/MazF family toxin [Clostridium perfringens]